MTAGTLLEIQRLQFSDKERAAAELLSLLHERGHRDISDVEVDPKPDSLNSLNGMVTLNDGTQLFFKTHVEEDERLGEYYNARTLDEVGYPIVRPERVRTVPGEQMAFYRPLSYPKMFDVVQAIEDERLAGRHPDGERRLVDLQRALDRRVGEIYRNTASPLSAEGDRRAAVHQLYYHRLRKDGRFRLFYENGSIDWKGSAHRAADLFVRRWRVNGVRFRDTLASLITDARDALEPRGCPVSVVGHGDAHNGNVLVDLAQGRLLFYDPAFAGRHDPLIDIVKPIFHNIFGRWMYNPHRVSGEISFDCRIGEHEIEIEHDFAPSPLRVQFLESKLDGLMPAVLSLLRDYGVESESAERRFRSALLCCPLLTVNLAAPFDPAGPLSSRYTSALRLLGMSLAIECASVSQTTDTPISKLVRQIVEKLRR